MANWWDADPVAGGASQPSPYAGAISSIESSGNYQAVGPETGNMGRALGKYQVMSANVGPWSKEVLGREVTPQEFIQNPQIQDAIFNGKFGQYVDKYGPDGAARAWFAGEQGMKNPNARDSFGTTVDEYSRRFNKALGLEDFKNQDLKQTTVPYNLGVRGEAAPIQDQPMAFAGQPQFNAALPPQITGAPQAAPQAAGNWWEADPVAGQAAPEARPATSPSGARRIYITPAEPQAVPDATVGAPPPTAPADRGMLDASARGVAQGFTANFGDEIRGLVEASGVNPNDPASLSALVSGALRYWTGDPEARQRYDAAVAREREINQAAEQQYPAASIAGNIGGGLVGTALLPGASAFTAGTLGQRAAQGAQAGAIYGGLAGAGSGEDLASRTTNALVGGGIGAATGGAINSAFGPRLAVPGATTGQDVAAAAGRISVPVARGVTSDSPAIQGLTQAARQIPILGGRVEGSLAATNTGLENAVQSGAARLSGTSGTRQAVGSEARQALERGIERLDQASGAAFRNVRNAINPDQAVAIPSSALQSLNNIIQSRVAAGETGVPVQGFQNAFELLTRPEGASFNGLQRARTEIGKAIKWDARNGGFITGDLKQVYGSLSDAMELAVRQTAKGDPEQAVVLLHQANDLFGKVAGETKELSRFLSGTDERIVDRIISYGSEKAGKGDLAKLNLLRKSVNDTEWDQVAAYALQRLGQNQAGDFSTAFFIKNYETMAPAAKDIMFGKAGTGTRQWIDDIATVSRRMNEVARFANTSNTGRAALTGLGLAGAGYTLSDPLGALENGLKTAAIGVPIVLLLTRPSTAASVARWSKAYSTLVSKPTTAALATFNVASRNLGRSVSEATGIKVDPGAFLRSLQGSVTGRADGEQQ